MGPTNPFATKKFRKLKEKWDKLLEAEGLGTIEARKATILNDLNQRKYFKPRLFDLNQAYYAWAMEQYRELRRLHRPRKIWRMHCEGLSAAEIGRRVGLSRWRISDILVEIKEQFKALPNR